MKNFINTFIEENQANIERDLLALVAIESVEAAAVSTCPFGENVGKALELVTAIGNKLGLNAVNHNGYYVTIDLGEVSLPHQAVGVLSHADVVPLGEGWHHNPLGEVTDSRIYGRGTLDDKGPTIATIYAMAAIKKSGVKLSKPVRLIVGGNEETGSLCIHRYNGENLPLWGGFSPDGDFPVIFAEKGIAIHKSTFTANSQYIDSITAGTAVNAVPGKAVAVIKNLDYEQLNSLIKKNPRAEQISLEEPDEGKLKITVIGKSTHGSTPERGENAIATLLAVLSPLAESDELISKLSCLQQLFCTDHNGQAAGIAISDEVSGKLTINLGVLNYENNQLTWELDLRYPVTKEYQPIKAVLDKALAQQNITLTCVEHKPPLYVDKNSPLVKTLVNVYAESGRKDIEPLAIGGGTYCRAMENFVAFGPLGAGDEDTMHQADEYIEKKHLQFLCQIYAKAIYSLAI